MFATRILAIAAFLALPTTQPQQPTLDDTIKKLDAASLRFQSAEAHVHRVSWNHIIKDTDDTSDGTTYFKRTGAATEMGLITAGKEARIIEYKSGTVRAFNPKLKCYDAVTKPGLDSYLTLGFGGSGTDLKKAWNITSPVEETIDGTKVVKLELTPKDAAVRANYSKITIWVDPTRGISLKQVLVSSTGDTNTATYSDIKYNQKVDQKPYTFSGKPCGK